VREFKRRFILEVLAGHRGNQCKAAKELGVHRNTLSRILSELKIRARSGLHSAARHGASAGRSMQSAESAPKNRSQGTGRRVQTAGPVPFPSFTFRTPRTHLAHRRPQPITCSYEQFGGGARLRGGRVPLGRTAGVSFRH
jgi:hypothetical protein